MHAVRNEITGNYDLLDLSEEQVGLIELGLSLITPNKNEHDKAHQLWDEIDNELTEGDVQQ